MPNGHTDTYNREWCDERHERSKERQDKAETRLDAYEVRLRNMEVRLYTIIALLQAAGIGLGKLLS